MTDLRDLPLLKTPACARTLLLAAACFAPSDVPAQPSLASDTSAASASQELRSASRDSGSDDEGDGDSWRRSGRSRSPEKPPTAQDLPAHMLEFRETNVYDPILAVYRVEAQLVHNADPTTLSVKLSGEVSLDRFKTGLERELLSKGYGIAENTIRVLPDDSLGEQRYAVSTTTSATMRKYPAVNAEQVNSMAMGWPMRLLRESEPADIATSATGGRGRRDRNPSAPYAGRWYMAQSSEGYVGFVRDDQVSRTLTYRLPDALALQPLQAEIDGTTFPVPTGAALFRASPGSTEGPWTTTLRRTRVDVAADAGAVRLTGGGVTSDTILRLAEPLMQTPYLWGGVTHEGIDCSGFTQFLYKSMGVYLPRDSRPQSVVGRIVAYGSDVEKEARAGDLVFFINDGGRITHIGMSLGDGKMIHSSGGKGVNVSDYRQPSRSRPNGLIDSILFARRVFP